MDIVYIPDKCVAQDNGKKAFVSLNTGVNFPSVDGFSETYNLPCVFINGISLGIPFTNKDFFFYLKAMYFQKSGTPVIYHVEIIDDETVLHTTRDWDDKIIYKQLLGNMGIQYNINFKSNNVLLFNGGITLLKVSEKTRKSTEVSGINGFNGFFFCFGYEKRIFNNLSLFSECQYNFDMWRFKLFGYEIDIKNGGANLNIGVRYYFSQDRK
jgi:hypothetical protein